MKRLKIHFAPRRAVKKEEDVDLVIGVIHPEWLGKGDNITFDLGGGMEDEDGRPIESVRVVGMKIDQIRYR